MRESTGAAAIREAGGWSQVEVAAAARTTPRAVARVERLEVGAMRLGTLVRIAQAMGVSVAELVPGLDAAPARGVLKPR